MKVMKPLMVTALGLSLATFYDGAFPAEKVVQVQAATDENVIADKAKTYEGADYTSGGETLSEGFDSSGFVQYVFKQALDTTLPRSVKEQSELGTNVDKNELQAGDVLFFDTNENGEVNVAAIYIGDDEMIYASSSDGKVVVKNISSSAYWSSHFAKAKRITGAPEIAKDNEVIAEALKHLGTPYVFGGESPTDGFDCSAFVAYVFQHASDVYLPRSTDQQWQVGEEVAREDLKPGDVIFFKDTYREGISHVGIYAGGNQFIHAKRSENVTVDYLTSSYWTSKYAGARRYDDLSLSKDNPFVTESLKYVGEVPYAQGGTSPSTGFDTAGFVQYIYKEAAEKDIPRYANQQWEAGETISPSDLKPGDLVFFEGSSLIPSIYIGNDYVVHVSTSEGVKITNYKVDSYWAPKYYGAKRMP
ncbi:C40 family peptidase [Priestia sp. YIM B13446]|uniref:C40 family peptidase n=1 Tax=unclassified Priestia TaxID=2800374 RepID=UPI00366DCFBD